MLFLILLFTLLPSHAADLGKAHSLLMHGRHEEAAEIYKPEAATIAQAAVGWAACLESQGKMAAAVEALAPLAGKCPEIQAQLARLAFDRGDWVEAHRRANATLQLASAHPLALYILAELARTSGRLEEAESKYRRLISFYNSHDVKNAESLRWIGRAAAQYARWNRLSDQFDFLVNDLFPASVKLDPDFWPAHFEAGRLFMEKYNRADAAKEFQAALEINPRAAEVHAALAELAMEDFQLDRAEASLRRAMEINPSLPAIWRLKADMAWLNDQTGEALRLLREKLLPLNPLDESSLARIAACYLLLDASAPESGPDKTTSTRFDTLAAEVLKRNPHAGEFYTELAEMLQVRKRHAAAERYFREAIRLLPRQPKPHAGLGLHLMRMGREGDARALLKDAFDADPFHVRVKNSLDVLDVLDAMQSRITPHFVIKYEKTDARLVPYLARHLETVHGKLKQQFGYEPPGPTLVEIFNESRGQSGHAWFSARMVGLPYLGTVAASTGRIVAMTSPDEPQTHGNFAWARVLKHEMVHVFNLQQTGYNIPHWFTEGLAVNAEKVPRPYRWTVLLHRRAAAGTLMDLETVNAGFARAMDGDECQLAYCQSELYVEYMLALGGSDVLKRMVAAYTENPSTDAALRKVFGISQAEFERGHSVFLRKQIDATPLLTAAESGRFRKLAGMKLKAEKYGEAAEFYAAAERLDPTNPQWTAGQARVYLAAGQKQNLAQALVRFAQIEPDDLPSRKKLAELALERREAAIAQRWATEALEIQVQDADAHRLLAAALVELNELDRAIEEFEAAVELNPDHLQQRFALADALLQAQQPAKAKKVLEELLHRDPQYPGADTLLESLKKEP